MMTMDIDRTCVTGIVVLGAQCPGHASALSLFNASAAESQIKYFAGFLGACFLPSVDGKTLLEYLQWQSMDHLKAVLGNYYYYDHIQIAHKHLSHHEAAFYQLVRLWNRGDSTLREKPITMARREDALFAVGLCKTEAGLQSDLLKILSDAQPTAFNRHPAVKGSAVHAGQKGDQVAVILKLDENAGENAGHEAAAAMEELFGYAGKVGKPRPYFVGVHRVGQTVLAGRPEIGPLPYRILPCTA